jgi:hypothetical protein
MSIRSFAVQIAVMCVLEEDNIVRCRRSALSSRNRRLRNDLLSVVGLKLLRQKMFDEIWKWIRHGFSVGISTYSRQA